MVQMPKLSRLKIHRKLLATSFLRLRAERRNALLRRWKNVPERMDADATRLFDDVMRFEADLRDFPKDKQNVRALVKRFIELERRTENISSRFWSFEATVRPYFLELNYHHPKASLRLEDINPLELRMHEVWKKTGRASKVLSRFRERNAAFFES